VTVTGERERMIAGERYDAYDPDLIAERRRARDLCRRFNGADDEDEQRALLGDLLGGFGPSAAVLPPFRCDYGWNVFIGAGSVVTRDIPPDCVAAGNPCRVLRKLV
jgi:maltose O-acetyltransferase